MTPHKKLHLIAIGGSVMHALALALKQNGHTVTGSDDEIFEPAKTNLSNEGLLPDSEGWNPHLITGDIDTIILGMHATSDNPELLRAQELNIPIMSFPEYVFSISQNKQRIVIGGSHGKTTITSMIIHVLKYFDREFDYLVGAHISGFDRMAKLSDAPIIILEGDEYPSSKLDMRPKFLNYQHHIGVISGIAWDHINVFATEEEYVAQFDAFADATPKAGSLVYCEEDPIASMVGLKERQDVVRLPYKTHAHLISNGITYLVDGDNQYPVKFFGKHNLLNTNAALEVLKRLGITKDEFYEAIITFVGADMRLQCVSQTVNTAIYRDYAHAPSKVTASTIAVKEQFPERHLVACLELHTFSSLSKTFLSQYKRSLDYANEAIVYFNPKTIEHKRLPEISKADIEMAFGYEGLTVFDDSIKLEAHLKKISLTNKNVLMMSSGTFAGLDLENIV